MAKASPPKSPSEAAAAARQTTRYIVQVRYGDEEAWLDDGGAHPDGTRLAGSRLEACKASADELRREFMTDSPPREGKYTFRAFPVAAEQEISFLAQHSFQMTKA